MDEKKEVILGMRKDYSFVNTSKSPDEMFSFACAIMNHTLTTLEAYNEKISPSSGALPDREGLINDVLKILNSYALVDKGMDPKEALEVLGVNADVKECKKDTE